MLSPATRLSPVKRRVRRTNAELARIDEAIVGFLDEEHPATVRGTYYRVEMRGLVPKTHKGYAVVQRQLLKLRRAEEVPCGWITDGTRWLRKPKTWSDADQMLEDAGESYRRALWNNQPVDVMILLEKDAISGVIEP